jgi:hypothetical protein
MTFSWAIGLPSPAPVDRSLITTAIRARADVSTRPAADTVHTQEKRPRNGAFMRWAVLGSNQ